MVSWLLTSIPRYFSARQLPSHSSWNLVCCVGLLWLKCKTWHSASLNLLKLSSAHPSNLSRSLYKALPLTSRRVSRKVMESCNMVRVVVCHSCNPFLHQTHLQLGCPHNHMVLNISPIHKTHLVPRFAVLLLDLRARSTHSEGTTGPTSLPVLRAWVPLLSLRGKGLVSAHSIHQILCREIPASSKPCSFHILPPISHLSYAPGLRRWVFLQAGTELVLPLPAWVLLAWLPHCGLEATPANHSRQTGQVTSSPSQF